MYDVAEHSILCSPLVTVGRGGNIEFSSCWPPIFERQAVRVVGSNNGGKSAFLSAVSLLLADSARVAGERTLLFAPSYEHARRLGARLALTLGHAAWLSRPRFLSRTLCLAPTVDRLAVKGFDVSIQVLLSRRPSIAELVQRVGRYNRSANASDALLTQSEAFGNDAPVDEAKVSALVQLVRKIELRRLARIERELLLALRRLIEGSRLQLSVDYFAPSRGESAFRLPLTGARTPTAPPITA